MNTIKIISLFSLLTVFIISCKKEKQEPTSTGNTADTEKPQITLSSPAESAMFNNGDTIHIHGTASDNDALHELKIEIKNSSNKDIVVFSQAPSVHALKTYNIHFMYVAKVNDHSDFVLTATALDHNNNVGTKMIKMHVMH